MVVGLGTARVEQIGPFSLAVLHRSLHNRRHGSHFIPHVKSKNGGEIGHRNLGWPGMRRARLAGLPDTED